MQSVLLALLLTTLVHSTLLGLLALLVARRTSDPSRRGWLLRTAIIAPLMTASVQVAAGGWLGWGGWALPGAGMPAAEVVTGTANPAMLDALAPSEAPRVEPRIESAPTPPREGRTNDGATWRTWALCIWLTGAAAGALNLVQRRRRFLGALRRSRFRDADARHRLRLLTNARDVRLSASKRLSAPLAISSREICVPEDRWHELTADEKEALLAHELAHVERRDPMWFLVEQTIERVLFLQPLLRVLRRASRRAAELACDERAARATRRPIELARCLATVAGWSQRDVAPTSMASMAHGDAPVVDRVERLLQMDALPAHATRQRAFIFGLGAALVAFACVAPNIAADGRTSELRYARALPLESDALLVAIDNGGSARLARRGGEEELGTFDLDSDLSEFRTALERAASEFPRGGPGELSEMLADGILRIRTTPDTPFHYAQLVMQTCGTRNVLLWNLELETAGREDTVFQYRLPTDVGVSSTPSPGRLELDLRVAPSGNSSRSLEVRLSQSPWGPLEEIEEEIEEEVEPEEVEPEEVEEIAELEDPDGAEGQESSVMLANSRAEEIAEMIEVLDPVEQDDIEVTRGDWGSRDQLRTLGAVLRESGIRAVVVKVYPGVTGIEVAALMDDVICAGATDIFFVGVFPR